MKKIESEEVIKKTKRPYNNQNRKKQKEVESFNEDDYLSSKDKPITRADCENIPRPCPFVSCRYNLYADHMESGKFKKNFKNKEPHQMKSSCALDIADEGEHDLHEISLIVDLSKERVRQITEQALIKVIKEIKSDKEKYSLLQGAFEA